MNRISPLKNATPNENEIKISLKPNPHSLERSLAPLWKFTYYGGMLLDWCRPIHRGRSCTIIRCLVIALALTIALCKLLSLTLELERAITNPGIEFQDIITLIARISFQPIILLTWLLFLIRRRKYLDFFRDWAKQESLTPAWTVDYSSIRQLYLSVNAVFCIFHVCLVLFSVYLVVVADQKISQDVLIYYLPNLWNSTWFSVVIRVKFVLCTLFTVTFITVADLVPSFVYYHAAKNIEAIEREIRLQVMNDGSDRFTRIKQIWYRFEEWRRLIRSADQLFGEIIISNHGTSFIIICCDVCSVLNYFKNQKFGRSSNGYDYFDGYGHIMFILFNTLRLVFGIFMMAKIPKECDSLSTILIHISTFQYHSADKEERYIMKSFINRLQFGGLVARPASFYSITPSILLTMLSLIVTYSVIMLQT